MFAGDSSVQPPSALQTQTRTQTRTQGAQTCPGPLKIWASVPTTEEKGGGMSIKESGFQRERRPSKYMNAHVHQPDKHTSAAGGSAATSMAPAALRRTGGHRGNQRRLNLDAPSNQTDITGRDRRSACAISPSPLATCKISSTDGFGAPAN